MQYANTVNTTQKFNRAVSDRVIFIGGDKGRIDWDSVAYMRARGVPSIDVAQAIVDQLGWDKLAT